MFNQSPDILHEEINIRDYWRVILKRRWIIITFFLVVVTTVAIHSLTMTPVYRATSKILIERANPNILTTQELFAISPSGQDFYQTQYKILESRSLAYDVVKRLNLAQYSKVKPEEEGKESFITSLNEKIINFLKTDKEKKSSTSNRRDYSISRVTPADDSGLVNAFLSGRKIEPIRNSRLVNISFDSTDPGLAARVANTTVQAYIDWSLGLRLKSQQAASRFLDDQVKEAQRKLEASELALQQYREKYGISLVASQGGGAARAGQDLSRQKLMKVSTQLLEATNRRIEAEIKYNKARELLKNTETAETIPEVVNNPVIISIKGNEVQLLREKAEKSQKYGPRHPTMVALDQEIGKLRKQKFQEIKNIVAAMKSSHEVALSQERFLEKALGLSRDETIDRDKIAIQYQFFQQEVESSRNLYDMLLKRFKETSISEEDRNISIHMIDRAEVPKAPVKPRTRRALLLAVVVGLFGGVGVAFFLEYLDNTVKTPDDLERYFGLPYLGPLYHYDVEDPEFARPELIILNEPRSAASEAYRGLRTGILFSTPGHPPRSLLVTSSGVGEGKTITCANLAVAMAQADAKILVLDCDMRRPRIHKIFGIENEQGMSNVLVGDGDWRDVRISTDIPNLDFISAGRIPPNPAELIGSERMKNVIKEMTGEYDRVIIDSLPLIAVTDPVLLSHLVEGVILVIHAGVTSRDLVTNGIRQLRDAHVHILGGVLNNVKIERGSYYYYQYQYYYSDEDVKKKKKRRR